MNLSHLRIFIHIWSFRPDCFVSILTADLFVLDPLAEISDIFFAFINFENDFISFNSKLFYQHRNHRLRLLDLAVDHGNRTDRAVCRENFPVCIKNPAARRLDPALPLVQIIRLLGIIDGPEHTQIHQPPGKSDHHSHAEYPQKNRLFPVIRFVFTHRIPHSRIHYDNTIWKLLWGYVFCFLCFFTLH